MRNSPPDQGEGSTYRGSPTDHGGATSMYSYLKERKVSVYNAAKNCLSISCITSTVIEFPTNFPT